MANLIERLEAQVATAPPLPWHRDTGCWPDYIVDAQNGSVAAEVDADNAEFIATAVNALPALLKLARAADALRKALPGYEITGDEVVLEERELFEVLEPLFREEGS